MAGGFGQGPPHGLQCSFGCQVIPRLLSLSDSSLSALFPALPSPFVMVSMGLIIGVSTVFQCDGAGWVVAAHRVVMDTLRFQLSCIRGSTLLVGTIPQAHLLLMSLR